MSSELEDLLQASIEFVQLVKEMKQTPYDRWRSLHANKFTQFKDRDPGPLLTAQTWEGGKFMSEFETKDSGKREHFETGMQRDTEEGKVSWDLIFDGPIIERYAELLTRGAKKYSDGNWMLAATETELRRFRRSAARHFAKWMRGEVDEDHAAAVIFNLNGYEYVKSRLNSEHE